MARYSAEELGIDIQAEDEASAAGWNFPTKWYTSPGIYELEFDAIFARAWQYVAGRSSLARSGDIVLGQVGEVPVVITSDEDGQLHGFLNACRHRGHPVVREDGNRGVLTCGYHGWTYKLDGNLKRAPGSEVEPTFDFEALSLIPVAVDAWGEAVFVNLDVDAPSYASAHPEFAPFAVDKGIAKEFDGYTFHGRYTYDVNANWKSFYDNDVECYHCPTIHRTSFNAAYSTEPGEYEYDESASGDVMGYRFERRPKTHGEQQDTALRSENNRSIRSFPGFLIAQQDEIAMMTQIVPTGVETCRYVVDFYSEKNGDSDRVKRWLAMWDQTFREDAEVCEVQHQSFRLAKRKRNRIMASREPAVMWVRNNIWTALKQYLK